MESPLPRIMTVSCDQLAPFLDGELPPSTAKAVERHLAGCARCQKELHALMQLEALGLALAKEDRQARTAPPLNSNGHDGPGTGKILPLRLQRYRKLLRLPIIVTTTAAAAAVALLFWHRQDTALPGLGPARTIEGRLSYPGADRYRPYEVQRLAGPAAVEHIPMATVGALEQQGDAHGAAAAYLLMGFRDQAIHSLEIASRNSKTSHDVDSDRALLALMAGDPEAALRILAPLLDEKPKHAQALWNRALALREMGLLLAAARAFDEVADLNEPGWSQEAREQAGKLRDLAREQKASWDQMTAHGEEFVRTGQGLSLAEIDAQPDLARHYFYGAVRLTATPERIASLRPVAQAIDKHYDGTILTDQLDRMSRSNLGRRASLVRAYRELTESSAHDPKVAQRWLASAGRDASAVADVLLGIADYTGERWREIPLEFMDTYHRLAKETGDPWFMLLADELEANAHVLQRDYATSERILTDALTTCEELHIELRCISIEHLLGHTYVGLHRMSDARHHLMSAWARARRANHWRLEQRILEQLVEFSFRQDDSGTGSIAAACAYLDELALRDPSCDNRLHRHRLLATMLVIQNQLPAARRELQSATELLANNDGTCKKPPFSIQVALARSFVLDDQDAPQERAALQAELEAFRSTAADSPGELAFIDHIAGRLLLSHDRTAALSLLHRSIATADQRPADDITARKARAHSYMLLIRDASAHGEHDRALSWLAEEKGLEAADRCVVGIAAEHDIIVIARGADGAIVATRKPFGTGGIAADQVVSGEIQQALASCEIVDVFARAPYQGSPRLLPADLAWRFRGRRPAEIGTGAARRRVIIADVEPPRELGLPRLMLHSTQSDAEMLRGAAATPRAVLGAIADATAIEIHAHGILDASMADTAFLALSPDGDGRYQLTADDIRQQRLAGAPTVLLGACQAAYTTRFFHDPSSLASAFLEAGARTVIASPAPIPDSDATAVFETLHQQVAAGEPAAKALRSIRTQRRSTAQRDWIGDVVVFE